MANLNQGMDSNPALRAMLGALLAGAHALVASAKTLQRVAMDVSTVTNRIGLLPCGGLSSARRTRARPVEGYFVGRCRA